AFQMRNRIAGLLLCPKNSGDFVLSRAIPRVQRQFRLELLASLRQPFGPAVSSSAMPALNGSADRVPLDFSQSPSGTHWLRRHICSELQRSRPTTDSLGKKQESFQTSRRP